MSTRTEVRLIGAELAENATHRGTCPECGRKKVFTVTRKEGGLVYNCFRASCGATGVLGSGGRMVYTPAHKRKRKIKPFEGELEQLSPEWETYLEEQIGWTAEHIELARPMYAPKYHRIAFPIYGPLGVRRGWVLRSYTYGVEPKALNYRDLDEVLISWYVPRAELNTVLIVEDIPSAVRGAVIHGAVVAMCGSGLGPDSIAEIAAHKRNVVWAFDQDATAKALKHHRKYGLFFDSSRILELTQDLKDMKENELCELLSQF